MTLTFDKPVSLHGDTLTDELAAAGFPDADVFDNGRGELVIVGPTDRDAVLAVVDSHVPPALPPDPDAELDAGLADVAARSDVPEWGQALIANLRGLSGHAGAAAGRRPT